MLLSTKKTYILAVIFTAAALLFTARLSVR